MLDPRRLLARAYCLCLLLFTAVACNAPRRAERPAFEEPAGTPRICTTTYPLLYFVQRLGGELVDASCPVPSDIDPQAWKPDRATILDLQECDLLVMNGAQLEKWAPRAALPAARIVEAAYPLRDDYIALEQTVTHSHGPQGAHSHEGIDGYIWPDPLNAREMVRYVAAAMIRRFPRHRDAFEKNLRSLENDLTRVHEQLTEISKRTPATTILSSHPFYNYLARRYDWKLESLLIEVAEMPSATDLVALKTKVDKVGARHLIWEAQPDPEVARVLTERLGLKDAVFAHCATLDEADAAAGLDYLKIMDQNLDNLRALFAEDK